MFGIGFDWAEVSGEGTRAALQCVGLLCLNISFKNLSLQQSFCGVCGQDSVAP